MSVRFEAVISFTRMSPHGRVDVVANPGVSLIERFQSDVVHVRALLETRLDRVQ
jgi:hypothetical protein